jgi:hypothetical protein
MQDISVRITTDYGMDRWVSIRGKDNFSLLRRVQVGYGAHPASYPIGTGGSCPEVKRPVCETDHSPPYGAEVKNSGVFIVWCLIN